MPQKANLRRWRRPIETKFYLRTYNVRAKGRQGPAMRATGVGVKDGTDWQERPALAIMAGMMDLLKTSDGRSACDHAHR
jgi:hypothetical protein